MSSDERQEGLVLRSIDYKDHQKIITLFTPNRGIISLIVKGIHRKKNHLLSLTSPFTQGEYLYRIDRSDLYSFRDGTIVNAHYSLRNHLDSIQAASTFIKALLSSQLPGKSAPNLYKLTLTYLKYIPDFPNLYSLTGSYLLKLLKHDGLIHLTSTCTQCTNPPSYLHLGEPRCKIHQKACAIPIAEPEWQLLKTLLETKSISELKETPISLVFHQKIEKIFTEKIID